MWAADFVYLLCTITSLVCAALLLRSYARNRVPLLFWSAVCFVGLFVNNLMVLIDLDTIVRHALDWERKLQSSPW